MNAEWKEKWCEALESDRYVQISARLRGDNGYGVIGFCCLGVAEDLSPASKWNEKRDGFAACTIDSDDSSSIQLTTATRDLMDVKTWSVALPPDAIEEIEMMGGSRIVGKQFFQGESWYSLVKLNDAGFTFPEIAYLIRKYL